MNDPLLRIENLHVVLGGNPILRGVSADIERGKITALIGYNGSGKTTLLRALLKEIPYQGHIKFFCGHDHHRPTPEHIGYVPQRLRIDANLPLTVLDLLALALQRLPLFFGVTSATRRKVITLLERVFDGDVAYLLNRPVENLSGGELQRILMGLALFPEPELLLLDEPAAGVDFHHQEKFHDLIARLNDETGVTVLLVSHDVSMVRQQADLVLCIRDGRIQCQGAPQDVLHEDMLQKTFGRAGEYIHHHDHDHGIKNVNND